MRDRERLLLVNSTVAFAIALVLMITVHEFAHGLAGLLQGLHPTVFMGRVSYGIAGTVGQQEICLWTGPIASLAIGVAVLLAAPVPRGFWGLLVFWFGTLNVQECTGYLMTGPFLAVGDIGAALRLVSAPAWAYAILFLVGLAGTVLLGRFATRRLLAMTDADAGDRSGQLRSLGLFAWLLGSALVFLTGALLSGSGQLVSAVGLVELLGTVTIGIFLTMVRFFMGREHVRGQGIMVGWPVAGAVLLALVVVANRLVLGPGLQL